MVGPLTGTECNYKLGTIQQIPLLPYQEYTITLDKVNKYKKQQNSLRRKASMQTKI